MKLRLPDDKILRDNMHGEILRNLGLQSGDLVIAQRIPLAEEIKAADLTQPVASDRQNVGGLRPMT